MNINISILLITIGCDDTFFVNALVQAITLLTQMLLWIKDLFISYFMFAPEPE